MSTRGCRAEAVILETLVSWSLSQVGIEKFRTCFVVFPDAAESDWNKVEIDRTLGIWIFSPKKTWKLLWWTVLIEDQQTCNCQCKRTALQKTVIFTVTPPGRKSLLYPHKLAMFDPRRSHTRPWSWLKRCRKEAGEWFNWCRISESIFRKTSENPHVFFRGSRKSKVIWFDGCFAIYQRGVCDLWSARPWHCAWNWKHLHWRRWGVGR